MEQEQNIPAPGEAAPYAGQALRIDYVLSGVTTLQDLGVLSFTMRQYFGGITTVTRKSPSTGVTVDLVDEEIIATVMLTKANTAVPGLYLCELWDDTGDVPLASGRLELTQSIHTDQVVP